MKNRYYELYQKYYLELEEIMQKYQRVSDDPKKLKGALAVNLFKQEAEKYMLENHHPFKISSMNSYIAGSKYEYDLLIVKKNARAFMDIVYNPEDVIAIIESKVNGLYNIESDTDGIAKAVNCARDINEKIRFGYVTISENVPVNKCKRDGTFTVNHWELTGKNLNEKINGLVEIYAVTLHKGTTIYDEGSDNEFNDFLKWLIEE